MEHLGVLPDFSPIIRGDVTFCCCWTDSLALKPSRAVWLYKNDLIMPVHLTKSVLQQPSGVSDH